MQAHCLSTFTLIALIGLLKFSEVFSLASSSFHVCVIDHSCTTELRFEAQYSAVVS